MKIDKQQNNLKLWGLSISAWLFGFVSFSIIGAYAHVEGIEHHTQFLIASGIAFIVWVQNHSLAGKLFKRFKWVAIPATFLLFFAIENFLVYNVLVESDINARLAPVAFWLEKIWDQKSQAIFSENEWWSVLREFQVFGALASSLIWGMGFSFHLFLLGLYHFSTRILPKSWRLAVAIWLLFIAWIGIAILGSSPQGVAPIQVIPVSNEQLVDTNVTVNELLADSQGYLWAGVSTGGIYRLDPNGESWENMSAGLPISSVYYSIIETKEGEIWVGMRGGVFQFNKKTISWEPVNAGFPENPYLSAMFVSVNGEVWAGLLDNGVFRFDPEDGEWFPFNLNLPEYSTPIDFLETQFGEILVSLSWEGIYSIDLAAGSWQRIDEGIGDSRYSLFQTKAGHILVVGGTIYLFDPILRTWNSETIALEIYDASIVETRDEQILIGLDGGGGVCQLNFISHSCTPVNHGIENERVYALAETKNGRLWAGLAKKGAYYFDQDEGIWQPLSQGLPENIDIQTLVERQNGEVWAGLYQGGTYRLNKSTQIWEAVRQGLPEDVDAQKLFETRDRTLWLGTSESTGTDYSGKAFRLDESGNFWEFVSDGIQDEFGTIWAFYETKNGDLWMGGDGNGYDSVYRFDKESEKWTVMGSGISSSLVLSFLETSKGEFLAGTSSNRIYQYNFSKESWKEAVTLNENSGDAAVVDLLETSDGVVWAGLSGYWGALAEAGGIFRRSNSKDWEATQDGLPQAVKVTKFLESEDGELWTALDGYGIYQFNHQRETWNSVVDGLPDNPFVFAMLQTADHQLLAGLWGLGRNGVYQLKTSETGNRWEKMGSFQTVQIETIIDLARDEYLVRTSDGKFIKLSSLGENQWEFLGNPQTLKDVDFPQIPIDSSQIALGLPDLSVAGIAQTPDDSSFMAVYVGGNVWVTQDRLSWNALVQIPKKPLNIELDENGSFIKFWVFTQNQFEFYEMERPWFVRVAPISFLLALGRSSIYLYTIAVLTFGILACVGIDLIRRRYSFDRLTAGKELMQALVRSALSWGLMVVSLLLYGVFFMLPFGVRVYRQNYNAEAAISRIVVISIVFIVMLLIINWVLNQQFAKYLYSRVKWILILASLYVLIIFLQLLIFSVINNPNDPRASLAFLAMWIENMGLGIYFDHYSSGYILEGNYRELFQDFRLFATLVGTIIWLFSLSLQIALEGLRSQLSSWLLSNWRKFIWLTGFLVFGGISSLMPIFVTPSMTSNDTLLIPNLYPAKLIDVSPVAILVDSKSDLWLGLNRGGIYHFDKHDKQWRQTYKGLPSEQVYEIIETRDGLIYAALYSAGVYRFDRTEETWFPLSENNPGSAYALVELKNGQIWIGTEEGVQYFNPEDRQWRLVNQGLPLDTPIWNLLETQAGELWAGNNDNGNVFRLNESQKSWELLNEGLSRFGIANGFLETKDEQLIMNCTSRGIYRFNRNKTLWEKMSAGLPAISSCLTLAETKEGWVWAGLDGKGIYRLNTNGSNWEPVNAGLPDVAMVSLLSQTEDGQLWAGLYSSGLYRFNFELDIWQPFNNGLPSDSPSVNSIIETSMQLFWTSGDFGVARYSPEQNVWEMVNNGLEEKFGYELLETKDGRLWGGFSGAGVYQYETTQKLWKRSLLEDVSVLSLVEDDKKRLWAGTTANGIYRLILEPDTRNWKPVNVGIPQNAYVSDLLFTQEKELIAALDDDNGIYRLDPSSESWVVMDIGLPESPRINKLFEMQDGQLWASSRFSQLLYRFSPDQRRWVLTNTGIPEGATIHSFAQLKDGHLVVGLWSNDSIYRFNEFNEYWEPILSEVPSYLGLESIIETSEGKIWLGLQNRGIYQMTNLEKGFELEPSTILTGRPDWLIRNDNEIAVGFNTQGSYILSSDGSEAGWNQTSKIQFPELLSPSGPRSSLALGLPESAIDIHRQMPEGSEYWFSYAEGYLWCSLDGISWNPIADIPDQPLGVRIEDNYKTIRFWTQNGPYELQEFSLEIPLYIRSWVIGFIWAIGRSSFYWLALITVILLYLAFWGSVYQFAGRANGLKFQEFLHLDWNSPGLMKSLRDRGETSYAALRFRLQELTPLAQLIYLAAPVHKKAQTENILHLLRNRGVHPDGADLAASLATLTTRKLMNVEEDGYCFAQPTLAAIYQKSAEPEIVAVLITRIQTQNPVYLNVIGFFEQTGFNVDSQNDKNLYLRPRDTDLQTRLGQQIVVHLLGDQSPTEKDIQEVLVISKTLFGNTSGCLQGKVAFIVTNQPPESEARAQMFLSRFEEGFVVIPISRNRIRNALSTNSSLQELDTILNEYLSERTDLYDRSVPVRDENFFGRRQVAEQLLVYLDQFQPIGVFALNKMGKTSFVRYLSERLTDRCVAVIDLQALPADARIVFRDIIDRLSQDLVSKWQEIQLPPLHLLASASSLSPVEAFALDLFTLKDALIASDIDPNFVIFLDEIDRLIPGEDDERAPGFVGYGDILSTIRGLSQQGVSLSFVAIGVRSRINRVSQFGGVENAGFQIFRELFLPPMNQEECSKMIVDIGQQMGLTYTSKALEKVYLESGGHPFLARQLCSLVWSQVEKKREKSGIISIDEGDIKRAAYTFIDDGRRSSYLEQIWSSRISQEEQAVLERIAAMEGPQPRQKGERKIINELDERHILLKHDNNYLIMSELFKSWIRVYILNLEEMNE